MAITKNWNTTYEAQPPDTDNPKYGDDHMRSIKIGVRERLEKEHVGGTAETYTGHGWHRPGSAMAFCQAAAPTTLNDTDSNGGAGSTALGNDTKSIGRLWVDTDTNYLYYWNGTAWTQIAVAESTVVGCIMFFTGTWVDNSTLPGWYACDGTDGTINLVDKFIRCGSASGATGGAATATLSEANLAAHTHTGPSHTHTFSATSGANSAFTATLYSINSGSGGSYTGVDAGIYSSKAMAGSANLSMNVTHTHSVSGTSDAGGTGASGSTGSGTAFSILPTYYTLIAIERMS